MTRMVMLLCLIAFVVELVSFYRMPISYQAFGFIIAFTWASIVLLFLVRKSFIVLYLLSSFTVIVTWRLAALAGYTDVVWVLTLAMVLKLLNYVWFAHHSVKVSRKASQLRHRVSAFEWQLLFIRLFIGFDLIPHFCEKLFAGPMIRAEDLHAFSQLGVSHPLSMVMIAGLVELAGALSLSCGFLTRLGSLCLGGYMLVATIMGHHFSKGFIWASQGGGWEYPVFWTVLILSFAIFGAGDFSLDGVLKKTFRLPRFLRHLMGGCHH